MNDPFASAPTEAQDEIQSVDPYSGQAPVSAPLPAVATIAEGEVVVTIKGDGAPPWIVIHATGTQAALGHFDNELAELMTKAQAATKFFAGQRPTSSVSDAGSQRQLQPGQPAGSVEAPSWAPPKPYDDFVYVTKVSAKTGKPWHAWMPPGKDDAREPKFFYPPR